MIGEDLGVVVCGVLTARRRSAGPARRRRPGRGARAPSAGHPARAGCACSRRAASRRPSLRTRRSRTRGTGPPPSSAEREIAHPQGVRPLGGEVPTTRSSGPSASGSLLVVRHGCPRRFAPRIPCPGHQPQHPAARDTLAGAHQRLPHPPVPVRLVVAPVRCADHLQQPLILDRSRGPLADGPLVARGRRHAQGPADRLDPEALAMLLDIRPHLVRSWSSSLAKTPKRT